MRKCAPREQTEKQRNWLNSVYQRSTASTQPFLSNTRLFLRHNSMKRGLSSFFMSFHNLMTNQIVENVLIFFAVFRFSSPVVKIETEGWLSFPFFFLFFARFWPDGSYIYAKRACASPDISRWRDLLFRILSRLFWPDNFT